MTVLIALNEKDKITLAADTMSFQGDTTKDLRFQQGRLKVLHINDMYFSACGVCSEIHNFRLFCSSRKPEASTEVSAQKFFVDFAKYLKDLNLGEDNKKGIMNNYFLVFNKKLFHFAFGGTEEVLEGDYRTDGVGYREAYMAMKLGRNPKEAIQDTIDLNCWAGGEPQVVVIKK